MPLVAPIQHTYTGKTPGQVVGTDEHASSQNPPVYVDLGSGNVGIDFSAVATGVSSMVRDSAAGDSKYGQLTVDFTFKAPPSAATVGSEIRNSSAKVANILFGVSGGFPTVLMRGGADVLLTGWTTATTLALDTTYRLQTAVQVGTGTTDGKTKAQLIRVSDGAVLATGESTALNSGTANISLHQTGKVTASGTTGLVIDSIAFNDAAYTYLAPALDPNQAPSVIVPADIPGATIGRPVTLAATATDVDGTIVSTIWTRNGTQVATTPSYTFTPSALGETSYVFTVTDDRGATATGTTKVTVVELQNDSVRLVTELAFDATIGNTNTDFAALFATGLT